MRHKPLITRFLEKTARAPSGCLEWTACLSTKGYGKIAANRKSELASRVAWELANGPIPLGMCVLHRCDNTLCCEADHLFLGSKADNYNDMVSKGRGRRSHGPSHGSVTKPWSRARGENHGNSKLTDGDVREIRRRASIGETHPSIAKDFPIERGPISSIVRRKSWKHVQ